jgi:poly(3-hydroxybutyrate) depolymerase
MKGAAAGPARIVVPTIVFHGDLDRTVHPRNGEHLLAAAIDRAGQADAAASSGTRIEHGVSSHGRRFTRTIHLGDRGQVLAEHWLLHGAGHAWSGGRSAGSFTDPTGPDATREMVRFFFAQSGGAPEASAGAVVSDTR